MRKTVQLIKALMAASGDNPHSLAVRLKHKPPQPQIYKFSEGLVKEPKRTTLQPIADHYGIEVEAFYDESLADVCLQKLSKQDQVLIRKSDTVSVSSEPQNLADENDVVIRQYDTGGAMGGGLVLQDQPGVIKEWRVSDDWLRLNVHRVTSPKNLAIVTGFGDSMRGMFNPGDPLLVDTGVNKVDSDAVYFFRVENDGFVKRLQRIPGEGILVISENKAYRDWTIKPGVDFQVFAKVVKVWKGEDF